MEKEQPPAPQASLLAALDLNCDLGEGEPPAQTEALMAHITSANIACGGHAGGDEAMRHSISLALARGVRIGAHPGLPGLFGRAEAAMGSEEFTQLLEDQLGRFQAHLRRAGATLHHLKLHGALYHLTERDAALRGAYVAFVQKRAPEAVIYALAGGKTVAAAREAGLTAWDEAFGDRGYRGDGSLVPRGEPGALLTDPAAVAARVREIAAGQITPVGGGPPFWLQAQTVCVHGDSPGSPTLLRAAAHSLKMLDTPA